MLTFEPTSSMLEAALRFLEERGENSGGAVDVSVRRAAFARYERAGGALKLPYRNIRWTSDRKVLPTTPIVAATFDESGDRPALAVENAGGLVHMGGVCLQGPPGAHDDTRVIVMPIADARRAHPALLAGVQHGDRAEALQSFFTSVATAFSKLRRVRVCARRRCFGCADSASVDVSRRASRGGFSAYRRCAGRGSARDGDRAACG